MTKKHKDTSTVKGSEQDRPALLASLRNQKKEIQQARFRRSVSAQQSSGQRALRRRSARTVTALTLLKKRQ